MNDFYNKENNIQHYQNLEWNVLSEMNEKEVNAYIQSQTNFFNRKDKYMSNVNVSVGDICFIDFGVEYCRECGYCHLGLVIAQKFEKIFVLPMTSNRRTFEKAVFWKQENLLPLPTVSNIDKNTTIFLNDGKFINCARVISLIASLDKNSLEFKKIKNTFNEYINQE